MYGVFTNAHQNREGASSWPMTARSFLDEIGDMSITLQPKLLRVLQEGTFEPVGSSASQRADVRVVAATNQDLRAAARERRFREDLFYRLNVVPIRMPARRDRLDDIPALASSFLDRAVQEYGTKAPSLTEQALKMMQQYPWPGNVLELENVMRRAVVLGTNEITEAEVAEYLEAFSPKSMPR
jgi:transcriptional regulator with GAF, ATPase, and Fis domain